MGTGSNIHGLLVRMSIRLQSVNFSVLYRSLRLVTAQKGNPETGLSAKGVHSCTAVPSESQKTKDEEGRKRPYIHSTP